MGFVAVFFETPNHAKPIKATWKEKLLHMDFLGAFLLLRAVICFLLAMQWGGVSKPWSSSDMIGTLVGAAIILIVFIVVEVYLGERAALNTRLLRMKSIGYLMFHQSTPTSCFFILLYYLPIYFQAVSEVNSVQSGIRNIPLIASSSVFSIVTGVITSTTGEYQATLVIGNGLTAVGCGLIYTLNANSSSGAWIGYQVLVGISLGLSVQLAGIVCQSVVDPADLATASAIALFF